MVKKLDPIKIYEIAESGNTDCYKTTPSSADNQLKLSRQKKDGSWFLGQI